MFPDSAGVFSTLNIQILHTSEISSTEKRRIYLTVFLICYIYQLYQHNEQLASNSDSWFWQVGMM